MRSAPAPSEMMAIFAQRSRYPPIEFAAEGQLLPKPKGCELESVISGARSPPGPAR